MSASRPGRSLTIATAVTGLLAAPLAVLAVATPAHAATVDVQILATNDFHGRLADRPSGTNNPEPIEIASVMAGAVEQLEATNPNTVFAAVRGGCAAAHTRPDELMDVLVRAGFDAAGFDDEVSAGGLS